jgi:hypothetical protein
MPLRFGARFSGTDSWGNPAVWRKGKAVWWVRSNDKEPNKREREQVIREDSTTEDEDEEEEREAKEESVEVKAEPISPPPLRHRSGQA